MRVVKRGGKVMVVSSPGSGKTTVLIPALAELLSRAIVSEPYYETLDVVGQVLDARGLGYFIV
ncbi:MAG: UvrD-helicase domain-containing protein, partial [Conexivisphaera sp.]